MSDQLKHYICYKNLIERNRHVSRGMYDKTINLPFILASTKDCPDNQVDIIYGDGNRSLNIAMKKPMKCIGDADALMQLGMYKVDE